MAMRGDKLREHILYIAKDVFLEMGFERASMDVIANRAETSKRTLYAHFQNKEKLYLAVVDLVRVLFLERLKTPQDYPGDISEVLIAFCGRFLEILLFARTISMCRLSISEAARFPEGSAQYFDVIFTEVEEMLSGYFKDKCKLTAEASTEAAQSLIGKIIYPRYPRALFGMDALAETVGAENIGEDFDLKPVQKAVAEVMQSLI